MLLFHEKTLIFPLNEIDSTAHKVYPSKRTSFVWGFIFPVWRWLEWISKGKQRPRRICRMRAHFWFWHRLFPLMSFPRACVNNIEREYLPLLVPLQVCMLPSSEIFIARWWSIDDSILMRCRDFRPQAAFLCVCVFVLWVGGYQNTT